MTYETIAVEKDCAAFVITLNRPDVRNAINIVMMGEVARAVGEACDDPSIRGVVITGGTKYFSAGADLAEALREMDTTSKRLTHSGRWARMNSALESATKPVIAAVEGFCFTGGFEMALACDIRIAARSATFAITSAKIGTVPGGGGTQRLPRIVGLANAMDILFSADPINAEHALRIGAVNYLVEDGEALAKAKSLIEVYTNRAPISLELLKRSVYSGIEMSLKNAIDYEVFMVNTISQTEDRQEGISAFLEKRKAVFSGQ